MKRCYFFKGPFFLFFAKTQILEHLNRVYEQKYLAEVKMKQNEKLLWNCYFADFETQNVLLQGNAEKHNRVMRNYKILGML